MIGIIGAMEEEISEIKKMMTIVKKEKHLDYTFYRGTMNDHQVVLLQGGIGKVNAAIATTLLFMHFDIEFVINIGSAGGLLSHQKVGDIVISSQVVHHDVDVTAFGRALGEVPGLPVYFTPDQDMLNMTQNILSHLQMTSHVGLIASGDQFIANDMQVKNIRNAFSEAICVEMEAAAIAQVCHVFKKKFLITRSLSDVFGQGDSGIQFDEYLKKASLASAKMCYELVKVLPQ